MGLTYEVSIGDEKFVFGKKALQTMVRDAMVEAVIASWRIEGDPLSEKEIEILYSVPPESIQGSLLTT